MDYQKDEFKIIGRDTKESEKIYKPSLTFWQDAWRRFKQNKIAMFFLFLIILSSIKRIFLYDLSYSSKL